MTSTPRKKPSAARAKGNMSPEMKRLRRRQSTMGQTISTQTLRGIGSVFEIVIDQAEILGADIPDQFPVRSMSRGVAVDMQFERLFRTGLTWRQSHRIFIPHSALRKVK